MKAYPVSVAFIVACLMGVAWGADIAVVVEHQWTVDNNYFSAFAYDPATEEFRTGGYSFGNTIRWSHILDDSVEPWEMEGDVVMNWWQWDLFARDGFASNSGSFSLWGMNFSPLDGKYFCTGIGILKGPGGSDRLDAERDLIILDSRLPNSLITIPSYVTISNVGGIYSLNDTSGVQFQTSGVQVGDQITLFPVDPGAQVLSGTFTVTTVLSETDLLLDRDPCWNPNSVVPNVGYFLAVQPHVTLATFRQNIPYYAADLTAGPKANFTGALSPDGSTFYLGDQISDNMIAVNTQAREDFTIFVSQSQYVAYVQDQIDAGRHKPCIAPTRVYIDSLDSSWLNQSVDTTVNFYAMDPDPVWEGDYSMYVQFDAAGARLDFDHVPAVEDPPLSASDYETLEFAIYGGGAGGQQIVLYAYDDGGVPGDDIVLDPPLANDWSLVVIPVTDLGVATIGGLVWENDAVGAQQGFYLDTIILVYTDPPPGEVGDFTVDGAGVQPAQIAADTQGRVWFSEGETDDILWTTDGVTLHTFMTSNELQEGTQSCAGLYDATRTGSQVMGLCLDKMGTVYWGDNQTRSIWKAPWCGRSANAKCLAEKDEIKEALGLPSGPRGMNCFTIRGNELLTFNFVDGNFIYKVTLDTFDYGDFDDDIDADADDLALFASVMLGPDVTTAPPGQEELFGWSDLDEDLDADLHDFAKMQEFATGSLD